MAIDRIAQLRDCGVFRDFAWPRDLPDMARFNLIYGWNGTGKTTISRILRNLEHQETPASGDIRIQLNNEAIEGSEFPESSTPIRVFNRDFMNDSVFSIENSEVPAIFVFGTESVEIQERVERLKADVSRARIFLQTQQTKKQGAEKALDSYSIARGRDIKNLLRSTESSRYNNYNKSDYRRRSDAMKVAGDRTAHLLDSESRKSLLSQHTSNPRDEIAELIYRFPSLDSLAEEVSSLLSSTVRSELIHSLKDDPELSEWVRKGLDIYQHRDGELCLFCEQEMPLDRLTSLRKHFNDQYELLLRRLNTQLEEVRRIHTQAESVKIPVAAELYDHLAIDYSNAADAFTLSLQRTMEYLISVKEALVHKSTHVFEALTMTVSAPAVGKNTVDRLNRVIQKHNDVSATHQARVGSARETLEADIVASGLKEYEGYTDQIQKLEDSVRQTLETVEDIETEISELEHEIVQHRRPAEDLNNDLHRYLGHNQLQVEVKETGYVITRNRIPAQALSEGETTAIALLYFLRSLDDHRFDLPNGIVVLDDPVSSLDANSLYQAFGLIHSRTADSGQLLILTHNFTLFRLVRNWFHHMKGQNARDIHKKPARFYMLDCSWDGFDRNSRIKALDPMLEEYESEYQYLFACIHRAVTAPASKLEDNYVFPNMARRLLESFLAFRYPNVGGGLWQKMNEVAFDETRKIRILRFVDTYSHADAIDGPEHDLSLLSESRPVLIDLLALIRAVDEAHFLAMLESVKAPDADTGGQ